MGSKGFILLGLLFVLSVLCHSGYSLQCYRCLNPGGMCTNIFNCTPDSDACLSLFGEVQTHYGCWTFANCDFKHLSERFGEKKLKYECCQKDLCNRSDKFLKALKDEKLQGLKTRQPGKKSASLS
ncbi:hypothetical protein HJG60_011348 [Phyllostomus discolor]|uniref:CD59 glycoprotein n=1 Tax=Phyllostomus discolor TaxID=89673 RepID=A0A834A4N9_9CHIR|nr:hypothetical protein HJG60_011348 [Phyllostomus discolor]